MSLNPVILASASPRRHQLLSFYKINHIVHPSSCPEPTPDTYPGIAPAKFSCLIAKMKATSLNNIYPNRIILAADTVVSLNGTILGKPVDKIDSRRIITSLSGQKHQVITGMFMILPDGRTVSDYAETEVCFRRLSKAEIDWYVSTDDGFDKAGAYGIQSLGGALISSINGDWSNVVGLPIPLLIAWLTKFCPDYWPAY